MSATVIYKKWAGMRARCRNIKNELYGGRGIKVCKKWDNNFMCFYRWAIKNGYKDGLTIDRIDSNGNYEPKNCRFATSKEQANNTRSNFLITHNDKTLTATQWAEELGIKYCTLRARIKVGDHSVYNALSMDFVRKPVKDTEITIGGITNTVKVWAKIYNIKTTTIRNRLSKGWDGVKAIITPKFVQDRDFYLKVNRESAKSRQIKVIQIQTNCCYDSITKASNETGVPRTTIIDRKSVV